ncbi:RICIN domain-containing protein [Vagococcus sp. BWB3-3]|uniref:RICIN domain-containing protein n=1 Tax=Vagococcus allomyrinae TaxID=2794353 RepID=A0A940SU04_9ENTE|nr:RICIN domain-containing protein [Vagococcus allomyrinae]MBP1040244.1 RICIN domain-containing protein [Vagococcus allomyrinae]
MIKKILVGLAAVCFLAIGQNAYAATIQEAGISKEQVAQFDEKATSIVKDYVAKNKLRSFPSTPGIVKDVEDGLYQIRFKDAPFYLTLYGGRSANGNSLYSWTHAYGASFVFYIKNVGNGEVMIFDTIGFRAVEIQNSNVFNGARLQLWNANPAYPTMRWTVQEAPISHSAEVDSVNLVNVNSNLAIDVVGGRLTRGNHYHSWQKLNVASQKFLLEKLTF